MSQATASSSKVRVRDLFESILKNPSDDKLFQRYLWEGPTDAEISKWQAQGYGVYQGKIRTILSKDSRIQMLHSDRLTAFDRLIGHIPAKGAILTAISKWWFNQLGSHVATHYLDAPSERVLLTEACAPFKVEVVVRGYLAGSILRAYEKGERVFCGVKLSEGLKPFSRLSEPIITPTTKAAAFEHDENISASQLIERGVCSKDEWAEISTLALKIFSVGSRLYADKGWILVDTKYEFGRSMSGVIKLIDEVHTPDSSRLWNEGTYQERFSAGDVPEMLDKEIVRRWLINKNFTGYGDVPIVPRDLLVKLGLVYLDVAEALAGPVFV